MVAFRAKHCNHVLVDVFAESLPVACGRNLGLACCVDPILNQFFAAARDILIMQSNGPPIACVAEHAVAGFVVTPNRTGIICPYHDAGETRTSPAVEKSAEE